MGCHTYWEWGWAEGWVPPSGCGKGGGGGRTAVRGLCVQPSIGWLPLASQERARDNAPRGLLSLPPTRHRPGPTFIISSFGAPAARRATRQVGLLLLRQQAAGLEARGLRVPAALQRELEEGLRRQGLDMAFRMPPAVQ